MMPSARAISGGQLVKIIWHVHTAAHRSRLWSDHGFALRDRDDARHGLLGATHDDLLALFGLMHELGELGLGFADAVTGHAEQDNELGQLGQAKRVVARPRTRL